MANPNDEHLDDSIPDDDLETFDLPDGDAAHGAAETADREEFDAESIDAELRTESSGESGDPEETAELPDDELPQRAAAKQEATIEKSISDTAAGEAEEPEPIEETVIDPDLYEVDESFAGEDNEQTVIADDEAGDAEQAGIESTYLDSLYEPDEGTLLGQSNVMQTINTRDLSPEEAEEFQRTVVDEQLASAASIADAKTPGEPTHLHDSGPHQEPGGGGSETETHLVIQQRQLVEPKQRADSVTADYELLELLGEGGMGVVYAANQTSIDRKVAIKMLKAKYVGKKKQRDNFLSEAVVTGDLDHPNIVPIYDVAKNESNALFYSMKRVKGTPWRDVLPQKSLTENIEILLKVADAIAFAHSRGVIHRDLKPENVMLGDYGEVLVMDWGLALTTAEFEAARSIAETSSMGCTPAYAAPELVRGPRNKIGPCSDVYLLGAILYQLVTGEPPHKGKNVLQCLAAATGNKITPTEKSGELVDIAVKAMATEPEDRFADVKAFQQAIRTYLSHSESLLLSTHAQEDLERARQSDEYNDYAKAVYGFQQALELWEGNRTARAGLRETQLAYARCAQSKGDFDLGMSLLDTGDPEHAELHEELKAAKAEVDARERRLKTQRTALRALAAAVILISVGGATWIYIERNEAIAQRDRAETEEKRAVAAEKDATVERDNAIVARNEAQEARDQERAAKLAEIDARKKAEAARLAAEKAEREEREARKAAVEAQKQEMLAKERAVEAAKKEEMAKLAAQKAEKQEREAKEQEEKAKVAAQEARDAAVIAEREQAYESYVANIGLAAERIAESNFKDANLILGNLKQSSPKLIDWEWHRLAYLAAPKQEPVKTEAPIDAVAWRPDGKAFLVGAQDGAARIWNVDAPGEPARMLNHGANVTAVGWSRGGKYVATGGDDGIVRVWDVQPDQPQVVHTLEGHLDRISSLTFAPQQSARGLSVERKLPEEWLVSTSFDRTAVVWNAAAGKRLHTLQGHSYRVWDAAVSPRGDLLVTAGQDSRAVVWKIDGESAGQDRITRLTEFSGHQAEVEPGEIPVRMPIYAVAFSPDGRLVASGGEDGVVRLWDPLEAQEPKIRSIIAALDPETAAAAPRDLSGLAGQKRALKGHAAAVHAVGFSPDGARLLSGSDDNTMKIWDANSGRTIKTLRGHAGWIRSCRFSPVKGAAEVLSGSHDGQARIWDVDAYTEQHQLASTTAAVESAGGQTPEIDHNDAVLAVAFDRDGKQIVTGGRNQTARIWDARTGKLIRLLGRDGAAAETANALREGHAFLASTVIPFEGGRKVLTAAMDNTARIWDAERGVQLARLDGTGTTAAAAVSPDGTLIATGGNVEFVRQEGTKAQKRTYPVRLWRTASVLTAKGTPASEMKLEGHNDRVTALAFSPDGKYVVGGGYYGKIVMWRTADGKRVGDFHKGPFQTVNSVLFTADGNSLLAASDDRTVTIWRSETGVWNDLTKDSDVATLSLGGPVQAMALAPGRPLLLTAAGGKDRRVQLWDLEQMSEIEHFAGLAGEDRPLITGLSVSPDGERAYAADSQNDVIHVIDLGAQKAISRRSGFGNIWSAAVYRRETDDQKAGPLKLATVGGSDARLWDLTAISRQENGEVKPERTLAPHDAVTAVAFSADGRFVVTGGADGALKVWDAASGKHVFRFPNRNEEGTAYHTRGVNHVSFSNAAGSNQVLSACEDGAAILWTWDPEALKATFVQKLAGHKGGVNCAVFSPDDSLALTTSDDKTARIWNLKEMADPLVLNGHNAGVRCGAFAPDGAWAATGGDDQTAILWDVKTGKPMKDPLTGHTDSVTSIDVSPAGTRILTGSLDKTARLWDPRIAAEPEQPNAAKAEPADDAGPPAVRQAREILTLSGRHSGGVTSVSFSADGKTGPIATGSLDGTAILWLAGN